MNDFSRISTQPYISLETYRKDGTPVRTPLWFAEEGGRLYIYTSAASGKIKRIRRNPKARVAVCGAAGRIRGEWMNASVRIVAGELAQHALELIQQKYGWQYKLIAFFYRSQPQDDVIIEVSPAE